MDMKLNSCEALPARRLGVLYFASFCTIALILGVSNAFILRELSLQRTDMFSPGTSPNNGRSIIR